MDKTEYQINDYLEHCNVKGLSTKTIKSYDGTLRLFAAFQNTMLNFLLKKGNIQWSSMKEERAQTIQSEEKTIMIQYLQLR